MLGTLFVVVFGEKEKGEDEDAEVGVGGAKLNVSNSGFDAKFVF